MIPSSIQRYPDSDSDSSDTSSKYDPENSKSLAETRSGEEPVTSSPGETPYTGSHADNYKRDQAPERNIAEDGPSGENTKNGGANGGGLWTSGGSITTGTAYHDEDEPDQ